MTVLSIWMSLMALLLKWASQLSIATLAHKCSTAVSMQPCPVTFRAGFDPETFVHHLSCQNMFCVHADILNWLGCVCSVNSKCSKQIAMRHLFQHAIENIVCRPSANACASDAHCATVCVRAETATASKHLAESRLADVEQSHGHKSRHCRGV